MEYQCTSIPWGEGSLKQLAEEIPVLRVRRLGRLAVAILASAAISFLFSVRASADQPETVPSVAPAEKLEKTDAEELPDSLHKTVLVVNELGEPIAHATIAPWAIRTSQGHGTWGLKGYGHSEPPKLTTDVAGNATIPFPRFAMPEDRIPPRELTCRVEHPDYAGTAYNNVPVTPDELANVTKIVLHTGARIEVTAFAPNQPIDFDHLHVLWSRSSGSDDLVPKVNARGRLELPRLPAGTELLRLVYLPEQGPLLIGDVKTLRLENDQHVSFRVKMMPPVRVEGSLDAAVPRPVKNGRVVAEISESADNESLDWRAYAMIQEDGTFALDDLPQGEMQVIALCDGFIAEGGTAPDFAKQVAPGIAEPNRPQVFSLAEGKNEILVAMVSTTSCRIQVVDPDGRPLAGAKCGFWPNVRWWNGGSQIYCSPLTSTVEMLKDPKQLLEKIQQKEHLFSATTDDTGIAVVKNLPVQERSFAVHHDDFHLPIGDSNMRISRVELAAGSQTEVTVKLEKKGTQFIGSQ